MEVYRDSNYWKFEAETDGRWGIDCNNGVVCLLPQEDSVNVITFTLNDGPSSYTLHSKEEIKNLMIDFYKEDYYEVTERIRNEYPSFLTDKAFREIKRRLKIK